MTFPEITIDHDGTNAWLKCNGNCIMTCRDADEARAVLAAITNRYNEQVEIHALCDHLDGDDVGHHHARPLSARDMNNINPGDWLVHPKTGASFMIEELQSSACNGYGLTGGAYHEVIMRVKNKMY
jgi:hypothetical protein